MVAEQQVTRICVTFPAETCRAAVGGRTGGRDGGFCFLNGGLAKAASDGTGLKAESRRNFSTGLDISQRLYRRRRQEALAEGALMVLQSLNGEAWDATDNIDMYSVDTDHAFTGLLGCIYALHRNSARISLRTS